MAKFAKEKPMAKLVQDSKEFKDFCALTEEDMRAIKVKDIALIQEISAEGRKIKYGTEPRLHITVTNGKSIKIDGYDRIIDMLRTLLRQASEKGTMDYQRVINLIESYLAGVKVAYVGDGQYIVKRKASGQYIEIRIDPTKIVPLIEAGVSDSMLTTQLMKAIHQEFLNKYGSEKRKFFFNGVYWSTDDENGRLKTMTTEEVDVMINNTIGGQWGETGIFEPRTDIRTWTSEKTYEEVLSEIGGNSNTGLSHDPGYKVKYMGGMEFKSLSDEKWRKYEYPDGKTVHITRPLWLNVSKSGGHRVLDDKNVSHYIHPGWIHLTWQSKDGCSPFAF